ncbi:hypothetical protein [Paludisphaera mucosa]|uniref:PEP-CTERM protein-sorting domain-containing protein n=1 Tax=Paludisphaera mucosa TaxID=3030827 RepID=A0ABT6FC76_9BACT|nr:hypothetical protein [Paludisphaera mucosa]MDG3005172.1 hypothetical protein [Paludisphaera mucosa]
MTCSRKNSLLVRLAPTFLILLLLAAASARGALIRYDFGGSFTEMTASGPWPADPRFTGTLIYDDAVPLGPATRDVFGATVRRYESGTHRTSAPVADGTRLEIRIAGRSVAPISTGLTGGLTTRIIDGQPAAVMSFNSHPFEASGGYRGLSIDFQATNPSLFADGKLPAGLKLPDLASAGISLSGVMYGDFDYGSSFMYMGTIDTLTATPVPEPTWTIAALLGAGLVFRRRFRAG